MEGTTPLPSLRASVVSVTGQPRFAANRPMCQRVCLELGLQPRPSKSDRVPQGPCRDKPMRHDSPCPSPCSPSLLTPLPCACSDCTQLAAAQPTSMPHPPVAVCWRRGRCLGSQQWLSRPTTTRPARCLPRRPTRPQPRAPQGPLMPSPSGVSRGGRWGPGWRVGLSGRETCATAALGGGGAGVRLRAASGAAACHVFEEHMEGMMVVTSPWVITHVA